MRLSANCMTCMIKHQEELLKDIQDEKLKSDYMREVLRIIAGSPADTNAPYVSSFIDGLWKYFFHTTRDFKSIKADYNKLMLRKEPDIQKIIDGSEDRILTALKLARVGNYIDFAAQHNVDNEILKFLIAGADREVLDPEEYSDFLKDLKTARNLAYLTDNCGEIVVDKLLVKTLKELYPELKITVIVRGLPVSNDATMEDAEMAGLTDLTDVIDNGTAIAGTQLDEITPQARDIIEHANIIISKGQGNFETLHGCGLNIYYLFLCKCQWFMQQFRMERNKGVFINEKNVRVLL